MAFKAVTLAAEGLLQLVELDELHRQRAPEERIAVDLDRMMIEGRVG